MSQTLKASPQLLMIFIKNPVPGKVKTRLGKDIGYGRAAGYYEKLLEVTRGAAINTTADKWLWYGDYINDSDKWSSATFAKKLQSAGDLGFRMQSAFDEAFDHGYERVAIIGSDCPDMSSVVLEKAFEKLDQVDAVIGPANDGGYYLLAMKKPLPVFENVDWSTDKVLEQTIAHLKKQNLTYLLLEELTDLDTIEDLKLFPNL